MAMLRTILTLRLAAGVTTEDPIALARFDREQSRLSCSLTGDASSEAALKPAFCWIQDYIEFRSGAVWHELIVKAINGIDEKSRPSDLDAKTLVFSIVGKVAEILKTVPDISLEDVVETLIEQDRKSSAKGLDRLLKNDADDFHVHLVFHLVGWISALWDPELDNSLQSFKLTDDQSRSRKRSLLHVPTIRNLSVPFSERKIPIYQLLTRFGDLFPNPESLLNEQDVGRVDIESACIAARYVYFRDLVNVLGLKLQWTKTLSQHLEYDRRRNILHVFSLPSICALSLQLGSEAVLAKLFDQYRGRRDNSNSSYQNVEFCLYLTEVLLSYRLIFGLHRKSRDTVRSLLPSSKSEKGSKYSCDPLLEILCTKESSSPEVKALLTELGADSGFGDYVSLEEFQFLGKRLMRLERISKSQSPSGIRRFWSDRRDSTTWFVTWAVLILGGGGLILQIVQLVFAILQVYVK